MVDTATPASTRVILEAPVRRAMSSTVITPRNAPTIAASGTRFKTVGATAQHSATISPAPALTPMVLGAARALDSTP